jgi:MFS family permease
VKRGARSGVFTRALVTCLAVTSAVHAAIYLVNAVLPLHLVALGGSKTQVGLLFSVATVVSMFLRPLVGGWNDRFGFRAVVLPGTVVLAASVLALLLVEAPAAVIALMLGMGLGNGLISTSAGVLASRATAPEHRGEALSIYYVATASALAIGPPLGFALYGAAGMRASLLVAAALVCVVGPLAWSLRDSAAQPVPGARLGFTLVSRHAVAAAGTMILTTVGHSSVYAFLPLYAIAGGMGSGVGWFYTLYSAWLIACRVLFRRVSDRLGRPRVVAAAIGVITLAYVVLALPPSALSLAVAALLLGSGSALLYPTMVALLVDRTPEAERGLAIGTLSGSWDVGVVIGSLIIGVTVERVSYAAGFLVAGGASILGLVTFVMTERRRIRRGVVSEPSPGVSF